MLTGAAFNEGVRVVMIGSGPPVFVPGHKRYRVTQGGVVSYVIVSPEGLVSGCDREPWLHQSWKKLRDRLVKRATIEDLDEDERAPKAP